MPLKIAILEDDPDRQAAMRSCLADRFPQYELRFFEAAAEMINFLRLDLDETLAIALDHDLPILEDDEGRTLDAGTGRQVADFLATRPPACPVVIHSTNTAAAVGMQHVLEEANWKTCRVTPYDDTRWIAESWFPTMRRAIVDSVPMSADAPTK